MSSGSPLASPDTPQGTPLPGALSPQGAGRAKQAEDVDKSQTELDSTQAGGRGGGLPVSTPPGEAGALFPPSDLGFQVQRAEVIVVQ